MGAAESTSTKEHTDDSHAHDVMTQLYQMYQEGSETDVTIKGRDGQVNCHSQVLMGNTAYFRKQFKLKTKEADIGTKVVTFPQVQRSTIESLVTYMYTGKMSMGANNVKSCMELAMQIQLEILVKACTDFMVSKIDETNCIEFYHYGNEHAIKDLITKSRTTILECFSDVCTEDCFLSLTEDELIEFIRDDELVVESEDTVYNAVMKWVMRATETTTEPNLFENIIQHVRFPFCTSTYIRDVISKEQLMDNFPCYKLIQEARTYQMNPGKSAELFDSPRIVPRSSYRYPSRIIIVGGISGVSTSNKYSLIKADNELWEQTTQMPDDSHVYGSACLVEGGIFICGENSFDENLCWFLHLKSDIWEKKANMLQSRGQHGVVAVKHHVYAIGGLCKSSVVLSEVEEYDFTENKWKSVPQLLKASHCFPVVEHKNCVYVFGGKRVGSRYTSKCQRFNVVLQKWTYISDMPAAVAGHSAVVVNDDVFLVGGDPSVCYRYSISDNQFTVLQPPGPDRVFSSAVVYKGDIVLLGGCRKCNDAPSSSCEVYTIGTDTWVPWKPDIPFPLKRHNAFVVKKAIE